MAHEEDLGTAQVGISTDGFFTADSNSDPRFVWDPVVHKSLGEDCFFLLLRLREQRRAVVDQLAEMVTDSFIKSVCIYKLYGYYDVLLRLWAPRAQALNVQRQLSAFAEDGDVVLVSVSKAFYDGWTRHRPELTEAGVDSYSRQVEVLSDPDLTPSRQDVEDAVRDLTVAGLLHYLDPAAAGLTAADDLTKVYLALSEPDGRRRNYGEDGIVVRRALETVDVLRLRSVYWSPDAQFPFLVKGVLPARDLPLLDVALDQLESEFLERNIHLRCMTLIIANANAPEADLLSPSIPAVRGTPWNRLVRNLSPAGGKALIHQTPRYREQVVELFDSLGRQFLGGDAEATVMAIFEALARRKTREFAASLNFLTDLEGRVAHFCEEHVFEPTLGPEWRREARKILEAKQSGRNREKVPTIDESSLTFQQILILAGSVERGRDRAQSVLGANWSKRLSEASQVRNRVAHGSLEVDWSSNATGRHGWKEITTTALQTLGSYAELLRRHEGD